MKIIELLKELHHASDSFMQEITEGVNTGDLNATFNLAISLAYGIKNPQNSQKSLELLQSLITQNFSPAFWVLGDMYARGTGITKAKDLKKSFEYFSHFENCDDIHPFYNQWGICYLAQYYAAGRGTPKDSVKAIALYEKISTHNLMAQLELAKHHETRQNYALAEKYYLLASAQGSAKSQYDLAALYLNPQALNDIKKAIQYLESAAAQGHQQAIKLLTNLYLKGDRIPKNIPKAYNHCRLLNPIDTKSLFELAECFRTGTDVAVNNELAFSIYRFLNQNHYEPAKNKLALCYLYGLGTARDPNNAFLLCKETAAKNDPEALFYLGNCHEEGLGTEKSSKLALDCYQQSAQQNFAPAYNAIGNYFDQEGATQDHQKAFEAFQMGANLLDANAQFNLGYAWDKGLGTPIHPHNAVKYYYLAASQGQLDAISNLATCYKLGWGTEQDYKKYVAWLSSAATKGDIASQKQIAGLYKTGTYVQKDLKIAYQYYKMAADKNDIQAQYEIATFFEDGLEVPQDFELLPPLSTEVLYTLAEKISESEELDDKMAFKLFEMAASLNYAPAINALGECYEEGAGTEKDLPKAFQCFERAAALQHIEACFNLGYCYDIGQGVQKNSKRAAEYYEIAAKSDHTKALTNLALLYDTGKGVKKDKRKSLELYSRAATKNDLDAVEALAKYHQHGIQIDKDIILERNLEKALWYYKKILDLAKDADDAQTLANAQYEIAVCYKKGSGCAKDPKEAFKYFKLSAESAHAHSQATFELAQCYEKGFGVVKNEEMALKLYRQLPPNGIVQDKLKKYGQLHSHIIHRIDLSHKSEQVITIGNEKFTFKVLPLNGCEVGEQLNFEKSRRLAENGNRHAQNEVGFFYMHGLGVEKNYKEAIRYLTLAAAKNHASAWNNLGVCYQYGYGVNANIELAFYYYNLAVQLGDIEAINNLGCFYLYGMYVEQDFAKAKEYFDAALARGCTNANINLNLYHILFKQSQAPKKESPKERKGNGELFSIEHRLNRLLEALQKKDFPEMPENDFKNNIELLKTLFIKLFQNCEFIAGDEIIINIASFKNVGSLQTNIKTLSISMGTLYEFLINLLAEAPRLTIEALQSYIIKNSSEYREEQLDKELRADQEKHLRNAKELDCLRNLLNGMPKNIIPDEQMLHLVDDIKKKCIILNKKLLHNKHDLEKLVTDNDKTLETKKRKLKNNDNKQNKLEEIMSKMLGIFAKYNDICQKFMDAYYQHYSASKEVSSDGDLIFAEVLKLRAVKDDLIPLMQELTTYNTFITDVLPKELTSIDVFVQRQTNYIQKHIAARDSKVQEQEKEAKIRDEKEKLWNEKYNEALRNQEKLKAQTEEERKRRKEAWEKQRALRKLQKQAPAKEPVKDLPRIKLHPERSVLDPYNVFYTKKRRKLLKLGDVAVFPLLVLDDRVPKEINILELILNGLKSDPSQLEQKNTVEDIEIERNALLGILGRIMECIKGIDACIAFPADKANKIRNVIFHVVNLFTDVKGETLGICHQENQQIKQMIINMIKFLKEDSASLKTISWEAVERMIQSPLLNKLISTDIVTLDPSVLDQHVEKLSKLLKTLEDTRTSSSRFSDKPGVIDEAVLFIKTQIGTCDRYLTSKETMKGITTQYRSFSNAYRHAEQVQREHTGLLVSDKASTKQRNCISGV